MNLALLQPLQISLSGVLTSHLAVVGRSTREAEAMAAVEEQHRLAAAMHRQRVASATALEELEREAAAAAEHSRRAHMGRVASAGTMSGWGGSGISHKWPSSLPFANTAIQVMNLSGSARPEVTKVGGC